MDSKRLGDAALVTASLALTVLAVKGHWSAVPAVVIGLAGAAGSLSLWWRRRRPVVTALVSAASYALSGNPLPILAAVYSGAAHSPRPRVWIYPVAGLAGFTGWALLDDGRIVAQDAAAEALAVLLLAALGVYVSTRRDLAESWRERAERADVERRLRDERARADERTRIAREMHDVLAHKVSLIALHAGALELIATEDDRVREGAGLIRVTAREALEELRMVLGVLQSPASVPPNRTGSAERADRANSVDSAGRAGRADRADSADSESGDRTSRADRAEDAERADTADGDSADSGRADRAETERADRAGRIERADHSDRAHRADRADRTDRAERADRTERADRADRMGADGADRAERADRMQRAGRADRADLPDLSELPGLSDLPTLVDAAIAAGQAVALNDEAGTLPPATARVVYRVVQEGLTNARKHAPGAPVTVSLTGGPTIVVDVRNAAAVGGGLDLPGTGAGLVGLAERLRLVGGTLETGPTDDGGWCLTATVPAVGATV